MLSAGRPGVKKGIIIMGDGAATQPFKDACRYAFDMAQKAKGAGIEIFTIGYGVEGSNRECPDPNPPYAGKPVTQLLADMATGPTDNDCVSGSTEAENVDGDHFFCLPKTEDLSEVFIAIAAELAGGSQLVNLPSGG